MRRRNISTNFQSMTPITPRLSGVSNYFAFPKYRDVLKLGFQENPIYGQLSGLLWLLPCIGPDPANPSTGCLCPSSFTYSTTLTSESDRLWVVSLRIRGLMETATYTGGSNNGAYLQVGGSPSAESILNGINIYKLTISNPSQIFYINRSNALDSRLAVDYIFSVTIRSGALITMDASSGDGKQLSNSNNELVNDDSLLYPIRVSQPYNGQFAQIDAVSVIDGSNIVLGPNDFTVYTNDSSTIVYIP